MDHSATHPLNAVYHIEGEAVRLIDGSCELPAVPGSATVIRTSVFGQPVYGDIDGDGDQDVVLFLSHDPGGSGTFYYVAAALNENNCFEILAQNYLKSIDIQNLKNWNPIYPGRFHT